MLQFASKLLGAAAVAALVPQAALAQPQTSGAAPPEAALTLGDHDGIFVDKKTFKAVKGNGASKGNAASVLAKMGAKEVSAGAIIYRLGDKLYILDGTPPANAPPQFVKEMKDWCPTCSWYVPQTYMR